MRVHNSTTLRKTVLHSTLHYTIVAFEFSLETPSNKWEVKMDSFFQMKRRCIYSTLSLASLVASQCVSFRLAYRIVGFFEVLKFRNG